MLLKYSRLSKQKRRKIIECFSLDLTASQTATFVGINRNTVNTWYIMLREKIALYQEEQVALSSGEFELDESYFGGLRKKTHANDRRKHGRGAENKVPVFGIKKRNDGTVYTQIIENASRATLLPIVKRLVNTENSIVYTDKWRGYDGLVFDGYKHFRVNH